MTELEYGYILRRFKAKFYPNYCNSKEKRYNDGVNACINILREIYLKQIEKE